jgi:hypothetical protein
MYTPKRRPFVGVQCAKELRLVKAVVVGNLRAAVDPVHVNATAVIQKPVLQHTREQDRVSINLLWARGYKNMLGTGLTEFTILLYVTTRSWTVLMKPRLAAALSVLVLT